MRFVTFLKEGETGSAVKLGDARDALTASHAGNRDIRLRLLQKGHEALTSAGKQLRPRATIHPVHSNRLPLLHVPSKIIYLRSPHQGRQVVATDDAPNAFTMLAFDCHCLPADAEIADAAILFHSAWGKRSAPVTGDRVTRLRHKQRAAPGSAGAR